MGEDLIDFSTLEIVDLRDVRDESLLHAFYQEVYLPAFPIPSQRENPDIWREYLWTAEKASIGFRFHALIAGRELQSPDRRDIWGGHLFEFHPRSSCGFLTYLAVKPDVRGKGLGRFLLDTAMKILTKDAQTQRTELRAVFGEINDPCKVAMAYDVIDPWERLALVEHLGGHVLDIPYVQPELAQGQDRNRHSLFVVFEDTGRDIQCLPSLLVFDFLKEFYESLGVGQPENDVDFDTMRQAVSGQCVPIVTIRRQEPAIAVANYAIAFHFVQTVEHYATSRNLFARLRGAVRRILSSVGFRKPVQEKPAEYTLPNVFESFERDILGHSFQERRPLHSEPLAPIGGVTIGVSFPPTWDLVSEGRGWRLCDSKSDNMRRTRLMRAVPSVTTFVSGIAVYHLVLTFTEDAHVFILNEYDMINLVKLYEMGEGVDARQLLRFSIGEKDMTWDQLVATVFQGTSVDSNQLRGLTIQVLVGEPADSHDWEAVFNCCTLLREDRMKGTVEIGSLVDSACDAGGKLKAVGGIVSGLLDFDRIEDWELADVLDPTMADENSLVCLHRGTLLAVAERDRAFESQDCRSQIGISPYLILPQAILLHNQEILRRVAQVLPSQWKRHVGNLESIKATVEWELKQNMLPNIFYYWHERTLYERGFIELGLDLAGIRAEQRLAELTARIEADARSRGRRADYIVQGLIAILTAVFVKDLIDQALESYPAWQGPTFYILLGMIAIIFGILIWRTGRT